MYMCCWQGRFLQSHSRAFDEICKFSLYECKSIGVVDSEDDMQPKQSCTFTAVAVHDGDNCHHILSSWVFVNLKVL